MIPFHLFENELRITGQLRLVTGLHIGRGNTGFYGTDNEVVKTADGLPYIPGSSMKGTIRSLLERISSVQGLPREGYANPCISTHKLCLESQDISNSDFRKKQQSPEEVAKIVNEGSCPLCHLFGNKLKAGKVQFLDAHVVPEHWIQQFDYRDGVAINRETGTAKDGAKYDFEAVPAGTVFSFDVRAMNLTPVERVWLLVGLEMLRQGEVTLGGKIAKGLGQIRGDHWTVLEKTKENLLAQLFQGTNNAIPFETYIRNHLDFLMEGSDV